MKKLVGLWLAVVLSVFGLPVVPASAEGGCDGWVFAVDAATGHLVEIPFCESFGAAVEVDTTDWRGYQSIFAVRDGAAAVVYAVAGSELWWRRQAASGAALGSPVRVGTSVNWAQPVVFASRAGYLELGGQEQPVRTFKHQEWASGGAAVSEQANLFGRLRGPSLSGFSISSLFAVGIWNGINYRVWGNIGFKDMPRSYDVWFRSGDLPAGVGNVVGDGSRLHGVNSAGEIVLMGQTGPPVAPNCPGRDLRPWQVMATAPGHYLRVVVPIRDNYPYAPYVGQQPATTHPECVSTGDEGNPWEWQGPGI